MKKRETIILGFAFLAVIYGALDYLVLSKKSTGTKTMSQEFQLAPVRDFAAASSAQLAELSKKDSARMEHLIKRAEAPWKIDPFIATSLKEESTKDDNGTEDGIEIIYSGFVKAGKKLFAVINGMEYSLGETLLDIGYKLVQVDSGRVILLTESNKEIIIPLEEN